jgi:hypothetical protein
MFRLFGILVAIAGLTACSSGVTNQGAGGSGTNCGAVDLVCVMTIELESFSIDAFASDTDLDGFPDELLESQTATLNIVINDPLGVWSNIFQGITFTRYHVTYDESGRAPNLGPRTFTGTLPITLSGSTGTGSIEIIIADQATFRQFSSQASGSTVFSYVITIQAFGRDFATNKDVVVVARINVEIGDFVESPPEPPEEEEEMMEEAP